jgi:hypothetical protein
VHLHKLPSNASSISCKLGSCLIFNKPYKDIIMPGVQKPHCDELPAAKRSFLFV